MRYAFVEKVGPDFPKPALLAAPLRSPPSGCLVRQAISLRSVLGQSARTPPSARLVFEKSDSDHYTNLTAQMVLGRCLPVLNAVCVSCEEVVGRTVDGDALDGVVLADGVDHVLAFGGLAKDGVFAVEVRSGSVGDEELGPIGIGTRVGHGENTGLVVATVGLALALELVAGATSASAVWATTLDHEV